MLVKVVDRFENMLMNCEWSLARQLLIRGLARWHQALPRTIILARRDPGEAQAVTFETQFPKKPVHHPKAKISPAFASAWP